MRRRLPGRGLVAPGGSALQRDLEGGARLGRDARDLVRGPGTGFSLFTQAFALGAGTSSVAAQLGTTSGILLIGLLPHALPELTALFLPLAAWLVASRRGQWNELLAATFVTVGVAAPVLVAAAFVETYFSPHLIQALTGA